MWQQRNKNIWEDNFFSLAGPCNISSELWSADTLYYCSSLRIMFIILMSIRTAKIKQILGLCVCFFNPSVPYSHRLRVSPLYRIRSTHCYICFLWCCCCCCRWCWLPVRCALFPNSDQTDRVRVYVIVGFFHTIRCNINMKKKLNEPTATNIYSRMTSSQYCATHNIAREASYTANALNACENMCICAWARLMIIIQVLFLLFGLNMCAVLSDFFSFLAFSSLPTNNEKK